MELALTLSISYPASWSMDTLTYEMEGNGQKIMPYAGDINRFVKPESIEKYFM